MKTVFFDIDTQLDFVSPAGALYVPGAELLVPQFARLNHYAAANGMKLISTTDSHSENDPEFKNWPPHCINGTLSQAKVRETILGSDAQIIIEKQALDCFCNPHLPGILAGLGAQRYVVYGVVTEFCVRLAAMGLLATGARVELVTDAIKSLSDEASERALKELTQAGVLLTLVDRVCNP
jgi:nicotinamidase/pyrazinamidase